MFNFAVTILLTAILSETPEKASSLPTWFWVLLVLIIVVLPILVLIFGPGLRRKEIEQVKAAQESGGGGDPADHGAESQTAPATAMEAPEPVKPDDLQKIEGIGPKIASVLQRAGVETFAQLAQADAPGLQKILDNEPRLRLADPTSWPEQAKLAAAGDWEALQKLQDDLQGGRR